MKYILGLVLLLFFEGSCCYASSTKYDIEIKGDLLSDSLDREEVTLVYYDLYSSKGAMHEANSYVLKIHHGKFSASFNMNDHYGYINIILPEQCQGDNVSSTLFLVEKGQRVTLTVRNDKMQFIGADAHKFNCQLEIRSVIPEFGSYTNADPDYFRKYKADSERTLQKQLIILKSYKGKMSAGFYCILEANIFYKNCYSTAVFLNFNNELDDSITNRKRTIFFDVFLKESSVNSYDAECLTNSYSYVDFIYFKELYYLQEKLKRQRSREDIIYQLVNSIKNNYGGIIRDRILTVALTTKTKGSDSAYYYIDTALAIVHEPISRNILNEVKLTKMQGVTAYNFQLKDTVDKIISLSDFRGKVVIVDYYFTGCSGCATLAKAMKPVLNYFKGNENVKFVSIDVDKSLKMFKDAVKSGIYTHPESVNLYTEGRGMDHEVIKYYKITSMPTLMVIDKEGRILSSDPPLPNLEDSTRTNAFIELISSAI